MKSNIVLTCLLLAALFGCSSQNTILDELEKILGNTIDVTFLRPFVDLLDPRNIINQPELVKLHGYPVEVHTVVTKDGYIIDIHRIPYGRHGNQQSHRRPVLITPSILCSSACWLILGPGRALPYILADLGYDVWLMNVRGNTYGRKHKKMNPNTNANFWQWTFHEIGMFDFPAIIDYVLQATKQRDLFLIAHSSATTSAFVMLSEIPEYNKKIKAHISLTPAAYMSHLKSPLLYFLAQFVDVWDVVVHLIGYNEFLPKDSFISRIAGAMCNIDPLSQLMCMNSMFVMVGFNRKSINETHIPIIFGHAPAGTSLRTMIHYGQLVRFFSSKFQRFNYGLLNMLNYKRLDPPSYKLNRITTPMFCFYSRNDWLVTEKDAIKTCGEIPGVEETFVTGDPEWMHNDFIYGMQAKEEVYDKILTILQRYN